MRWCTLVLFLVGSAWADNSDDYYTSDFDCPELQPQKSMDLDASMMGKWYIVEILEHRGDPGKPPDAVRTMVVDTCPVVKLEAKGSSQLRLLWSEGLGDLEYTFWVADKVGNPGYWKSIGPQNGSLTEQAYTQFKGSVRVMKAVASHVVLTFCSRNPDGQLYSVLLSREHVLDKNNLRGVHNLLERRKLRLHGIRETCANGGGGGGLRACWTTLLALLAALLARSSLPR